MAIIRTQQRALTSKLPHQANRTWAVPGGLAKQGNPITPDVEANAVHFDNSSTLHVVHIPAASLPANVVDSPYISMSLWVNTDALSATQARAFEIGDGVVNNNTVVQVRKNGGNALVVDLKGPAGAGFGTWTSSGLMVAGVWYGINLSAAAADTGNYTPVCNATSQGGAYNNFPMVPGVISSVATFEVDNDWVIGDRHNSPGVGASQGWTGGVAEIWVDIQSDGVIAPNDGPSIDFGSAIDQQKFIKNGQPVFLGDDGQIPLGGKPIGMFKGSSMTADSSGPFGGSVPLGGWNQGQDWASGVWQAIPVGAAVTDVGTV